MLSYAIYTDKGSRSINEDTAGAFEKNGHYCFILCDGLGGHGMGDYAAQLVVKTFGECFEDDPAPEQFFPAAFEIAQGNLLGEQKRLGVSQKMKTTAVSLLIDDTKAYIGHIGDSRLYCFKRGSIRFRTLDHSVPQMLVMSREIKESEIRHHPDRSLLLRVMGVAWDEPKYELMPPVALKKCQAFLLCSDGFWELIDEKQMCACLKSSSSPNEWLLLMAEQIKKNGAGTNMDNFTAVAVWV